MILKTTHYDSQKALEMVGCNICADGNCTNVIPSNDKFCSSHCQLDQIDDQYNQRVLKDCLFDKAKMTYRCHDKSILDL